MLNAAGDLDTDNSKIMLAESSTPYFGTIQLWNDLNLAFGRSQNIGGF